MVYPQAQEMYQDAWLAEVWMYAAILRETPAGL
jgi:hypothetical protein